MNANIWKPVLFEIASCFLAAIFQSDLEIFQLQLPPKSVDDYW